MADWRGVCGRVPGGACVGGAAGGVVGVRVRVGRAGVRQRRGQGEGRCVHGGLPTAFCHATSAGSGRTGACPQPFAKAASACAGLSEPMVV